MAEKRKFAALADLNRPAPQEAPVEPAPATPRAVTPEASDPAGKGRGRPATGKRSNPDYKLYAHYLRKRTHRAATAKLAALHADDDQRPDLSDLVEELLQAWLGRQNG
jgi:hypothetical protein